MPSGIASFACTIANLPTGSKTITPAAVALTAANGTILSKDLSIGDNTITVPTTPNAPTYAILEFPITTATVTWKGAGGDTGTQMFAATTVALFSVQLIKGLSSFILNATGSTVPGVEISFA